MPIKSTNSNVISYSYFTVVAFSIFDFDRNEEFTEPEMLAIFMNTCFGIHRLTRIEYPSHDTLLLIARKAFEMSDVNNDSCIEFIE